MRNESEVRKRYKSRKYQLRQSFLKEKLSKEPCNCVHNYAQPLDRLEPLRGAEGELRLCMLGAEDMHNWAGNICNTVQNARTCPFYTATHTRQTAMDEFTQLLADAEWLQERDPELYVLEWALGDDVQGLPWYTRILDWLQGERVAPLPPLLTSDSTSEVADVEPDENAEA